jgi:hypothetical protein
MPFTNAALNAGTNGITAAFPYVSRHTADPGTTGANETTAARILPTWPAASGTGDATVSNLNFSGGAASGACTYCGLWSAASGGTFGGGFALSGNQTFNASGQYTINSLTVNAQAN